MVDAEKEITKMSLAEQRAEVKARAAKTAGRQPQPVTVIGPSIEPGAPSHPRVEVKIMTRTVGDARGADPNLMHGDSLSAELSRLRSAGWTIHTTRVIGLQVGGLMLYFLLERTVPA